MHEDHAVFPAWTSKGRRQPQPFIAMKTNHVGRPYACHISGEDRLLSPHSVGEPTLALGAGVRPSQTAATTTPLSPSRRRARA